MRAVPLRWQVSSSCVQISRRVDRLQRLRHEPQRMVDQRAVVVAPGVGDARDRQAVLVLLVGERDAVALLRQHLADDLEADLMVVVAPSRPSGAGPTARARSAACWPRAAAAAPGSCSNSRRRNPCRVVVVPVLGDRQRRRPLVPADLLAPDLPRPPGSPAPSGSCRRGRSCWPARPDTARSPSSAAAAASRSRSRRPRRCAPSGSASVLRDDSARRSRARRRRSRSRPTMARSRISAPAAIARGIHVTSALCLALVEQPVTQKPR